MVKKYPKEMRVLHWLMALLIVGLLTVGLYMSGMPDSTLKWQVYGLHKSFGVLAFLLLIMRVVVRLRSVIPPLDDRYSRYVKRLAAVGHLGLYGCMVLMPLSGYAMSSYGGYGVELFGLPLPNFLGENKEFSHIAKEIHECVGYFLIVLISVHLLAVIKHRVEGKSVLRRMV